MIALPPDPFWLLRVKVQEDGACVPFETWLLYHYQWKIAKGATA
jgi:hypothetical protein